VPGRLIRVHTFNHEGKTYAVRAWLEEREVRVRVFLDDRPATRFTYSIAWDNDVDAGAVQGLPGIDALIRQAKADVQAGLS
jgi:hypothetical protein